MCISSIALWGAVSSFLLGSESGGGRPDDRAGDKLPSSAPAGAAPVLIDWIHANDFSMIGLQPETYEYHVICGSRRGFQFLASRGVAAEYVTEGPLTLERLKPHKLLFVNLVSAEREPFLVSEILAIKSFVWQGGSLFVVTDHTNAYFHSHRLKPLFTELGIESSTVSACDVPPRSLGGHGWITVTRFQPHPVTAGVECLAMQTGGCVDARYAVALTSEQSWADEWQVAAYGEGGGMGFFGNFARDPGERQGPLGIVLAKNFGQGRIAVVADQNMIADLFLHYADNYRLWLNIMAWLLRDERVQQAEPYLRWQSPLVALYEQYDQPAFGRSDERGYYHAFSLINRYYWAFANDRPPEYADLIVLARNAYALPPGPLAALSRHLRRGRNILVLRAGGDVLRDEGGVVRCLLRELGVRNAVTRQTPAGMRIELPSQGSIHLLRPEVGVENTVLVPPITPPNEEERQRGELLLEAVRHALGKGGKAGSPEMQRHAIKPR